MYHSVWRIDKANGVSYLQSTEGLVSGIKNEVNIK